MNRRNALKQTGLLAAGAFLGGCSARQNAPASPRLSMLTLPKVKVSEDGVTEQWWD